MANHRVYFDTVVESDALDAAAVQDQLTKTLGSFGGVTVLAFSVAEMAAGTDTTDEKPENG